MSYQGEKTCPLCAEEMDLTDQQLKPCKCGYEICVWCWHHIMDMAEKDESEGRCPACRSPYDKEKIVGRAGNCGRLVAEINTERKMKSQKLKTNKSSDGRKQLINVRVIRRNLVYIVGLPLDLADEDLLQRKEYFAQYGKVLKVSMSRTSTGVIQQFPNNTCSVYITYSKEEEAIRCIQFVHGFILDGRPLKACFGTTKYCHAWLRSVPCTNGDCLYLHEIGSQDDSFTKDEVISSYTRDRVQQITGATNNMQRRSGNMLPPPSEDIYINRTASNENPPLKNHAYDSATFDRVSPPNSSSGRSTALPAGASWGTRIPNGYPPVVNAACSNGPSKHRPDPFSDDLEPSSVVASSTQTRIVPAGDEGKKLILTQNRNVEAKEKMETMDPLKQHMGTDPRSTVSDYQVTADMGSSKAGPPAPEYNGGGTRMCDPRIANDQGLSINGGGIRMCDPRIANDQGLSINGNIQSVCSDISSVSIEMDRGDEQSGIARSNERTQQKYIDQVGELVNEQHDWRFDSRPQVMANACSEIEDDLQLFNDQRLRDPEVFVPSSYKSKLEDSLHISNNSKEHPLHYTESYREANFNADPMFGHMNTPEASLPHSFNASVLSNGYREDLVNSSTSLDRAIERPYSIWGEGKSAAADIGESNIISNILSMNFDTWDGPLTSPQSLAKLLGEPDTQNGSLKLGSSWKAQNSNESKFSFARQEGSKSQQFDADLSCNIGRMPNNHSFSQDYVENRVRYPNMPGNGNGFFSNGMEEYANFSGNQSVVPSSKFSGSRIQTSAPPGFSGSNRAPPPGFSSHERVDQAFDTFSGGQLQNNSSFSRNSYQTMPTANNSGNGDVEFIDPAIMMAVDKGRLPSGLNNPALDLRSNFPSQYAAFENDARLQMLMQQSKNAGLNGHWDGRTDAHRFSDIRNGFPSNNDAYGIHPRYIEHTQANNLSPYAQLPLQQSKNAPGLNGHWDGRIDAQGGSNIGIMDILRNERLGYDKLYNGYDGLKYQMPSSA